MRSIKEILEYTHRLKDNKNSNIETCKQNINNTKEQIKELENLIDVAEIEVDIEKFNNGKVELQNQKNALDLYSNQYERLMNEASLNKEEAQEILDEFNNLIEKEDKKLNQEALQYIKVLKELAEKSNKLFIDQDEVRSILQDMSKTVLKNSYSNSDNISYVYNKIKDTKLAEQAGQKKDVDFLTKLLNRK